MNHYPPHFDGFLCQISTDFAQIWLILKLTVPRSQFYYRNAVPAYGSGDNRPANLVTVPVKNRGTGDTLLLGERAVHVTSKCIGYHPTPRGKKVSEGRGEMSDLYQDLSLTITL